MGKNISRMKIILIFFVLLLLALGWRLYYIQILCHETFSEAAVSQYGIVVEGMDTRGQIFDRHMNPLTGGVYQYYYIIKAARETDESYGLLEAVEAEQIAAEGSSYHVYRTEIWDEEICSRLKSEAGAYVFRSRARYANSQPACHLIGYLNQSEKRGVSGLEFFFEEKLAAGDNKLTLWADAAGNILPGKSPSSVGSDGGTPTDNSIVTTIDSGLQKKCEELLACGENGVSGACIVTDAYSGEILAMASSPTFNPNRISDYLNEESDCLINKALQAAYPPGSVFKLVTAAAALEKGICMAEQRFECTGEAEIEGIKVSCSTAPEGGHGSIDMYEAMAVSCNCYFARLGQMIGTEGILEMACRFGLGSPALEGFPEESSGCVPEADSVVRQDISNLSIGQGRLLSTPLQITRMTGIIACGGVDPSLHLLVGEGSAAAASKLTPAAAAGLTARLETSPNSHAAGLTLGSGNPDESEQTFCLNSSSEVLHRVITPKTAETLQQLMSGVMTEGTASHITWAVPVWGKSGTAEAGLRGKAVKDCWFTGFCDIKVQGPASGSERLPDSGIDESVQNKRFVITVFIEDGISGSATALPVFKEITEYLERNGCEISG